MIIEEVEQGTPEWFEARAGHPSASCFDMIITPAKMQRSSQWEKYLNTLAGERIAGPQMDGYQNAHMARGHELEDEARSMFVFLKDMKVSQVGIVYPDQQKLFSCSPDGLMDSTGLEIKCPAIHTHVAYLREGKLPREYVCQVQGSMLVCGFQSWWFMSYYPGLPPLILEVNRDDKFCAKLKVELEAFCEELDRIEAELRQRA